ncbi:MAG: DUF4097 family beta strand repeat-containing protein, partial [Thermoanaerobaculia bacterium]
MRKITLVLLLLAIAPMTMAAERRIHKLMPLDANGRVLIGTHNGSITVTTWNQPNVDIDAQIVPAEWSDDEDVQRTDVKITGSGSSLHIESDYTNVPSHSSWFGASHNLPPIHYKISMPATATLDIEGHNSSVRVTGLRNDVSVRSHNGRVDLADLGGAAEIETHNGDVSVGFSRFAKASRIETHNGSAEIHVPQDARFHVEASGHHLGFDSEFGVVTTRMNRSHYVGDVNGGGPELRFESHNGMLRLRKR